MTSPSVHHALGPEPTRAAAWHGIKVIDLALETKSIASARSPERTARTLARLDTLRLTLMRLERGATIQQHQSDHELSIQTVSGSVVVHTANERLELKPGQLVVCERGLAHDIEATEESAILLTIGMSHRVAPRAADDAPLAED